jgi:hypothetical protein
MFRTAPEAFTFSLVTTLKVICNCLMDMRKYFDALSTFIETALQRHNTENSKQILPEKEFHGLSPNFRIHLSVSDLFIPKIGLPILLQENRWAVPGNICM